MVLRCFVGPAQRGKWPQAAAKPRVEHVWVARPAFGFHGDLDFLEPRFDAGVGDGPVVGLEDLADGSLFAWVFVFARLAPDGDLMSPPELSADGCSATLFCMPWRNMVV